jgi:MFS family permease
VTVPSRHDPIAALRQPQFVLFLAGRFATNAASNMLQAAVAWEVYDLTHNPFSLGVLGIVRFLPQLILSLYAGAVADAFDRRLVIIGAQIAAILCAVVLIGAEQLEAVKLALLYGTVVVFAVANQFENPARQALLPSIVAPSTFQNAITVAQSFGALASVTGPALAGAAIATVGVQGAWWGYLALEAVGLVTVIMLRPRPVVGIRGNVSTESVTEGLRFVFGSQVLLGCMTLDLFAVLFGGAQALLPVYANDILHVGPVGYGILTSSLEVGALLGAGLLVVLPPFEFPGRALLWAVAGFGLATIVFGFARSLPLSIVAYTAVGMADQIGNVMRTTTENMATPDALRGRMNSVSSLFSGTFEPARRRRVRVRCRRHQRDIRRRQWRYRVPDRPRGGRRLDAEAPLLPSRRSRYPHRARAGQRLTQASEPPSRTNAGSHRQIARDSRWCRPSSVQRKRGEP